MDGQRRIVLLGTVILAGITLLGSSAWASDDHRMDASLPAARAVQAWAWGSNNRGQLGTGTIAYSNVPEPVQGLPPNIVSISAGGSHVLALDGSGHVWAWGNNDSGQLGVPQHVCRTDYGGARIPCARRPVRLPTLQHVVMIAAGGDDSLALERDGSVWDWGSNSIAQLGSDPTGLAPLQATPTRIPHLPPMVSIATGGDVSGAISRNGTVWTWGDADLTATGPNPNPLVSNGPLPVKGLGPAVALAAGNSFLLALHHDGTVWATGDNAYAELGNGVQDSVAENHPPVRVHALHAIVAIATGSLASLALRRDGTVWTWGWTLIQDCCTSTPIPVPRVRQVTAIAANEADEGVLTRSGTMWLWGNNAEGELGQGTSENTIGDLPIPVRRLSHVVAITLGGQSSYALVASPSH